jgi:hypothetical protein
MCAHDWVDVQPFDMLEGWDVPGKGGHRRGAVIDGVAYAPNAERAPEVLDGRDSRANLPPLRVVHCRHELVASDVSAQSLVVDTLLVGRHLDRLTDLALSCEGLVG